MKSIALTIVTIAAAIGLVLGTASAYNEADLQKLTATGSCVECDLSGAVLIHWNLSGANLSGANLASANLTDTFLSGANLSEANLSRAILTSTSLTGANLLRAKVGGAILLFTDMAGATWTDGSQCERHSSGRCRR